MLHEVAFMRCKKYVAHVMWVRGDVDTLLHQSMMYSVHGQSMMDSMSWSTRRLRESRTVME